jgi:alpha-mannosidase
MKFAELIVLLPCHSLEDFPVHYEADEAEAVLSAWSALWHPRLIASAEAMPTGQRVDCPPETFAERLIIVPEMCERDLAAGYITRASEEGATVIRRLRHRDEIVAAALSALDGRSPTSVEPNAERDALAADFLALGFLYLQVELLTRRMRYMSNIDQTNFNQQVTSGAAAFIAGDFEETRRRLQNCFDVLAQAREHFYPVDAYLIDVVLVAATTLGPSLQSEINSGTPVSLLITGEELAQMAERQPDTLAALRAAWSEKQVGIIGGSFGEADLPLADPESALADIERGLALFNQQLGHLPAIWGSRRFALTPWLPQLLAKKGFVGVWHVALEDGQFPRPHQAKAKWESLDGTAIDILGQLPIDAAKADSYLGLSIKMGESMDRDHVACIVLAHWPGKAACWHEDLRRGHRYAPILGKFVTIEDFFGGTSAPSQFVSFEPDEYRPPFLQQDIIRERVDPISRHVRRHLAAATHIAESAIQTTAICLGSPASTWVAPASDLPRGATGSASAASPSNSTSNPPASHAISSTPLQVEGLAKQIPRVASGGSPGVLVFNPHSFSRRIPFTLPPGMSAPEATGHILASGNENGASRAVVEVPPLGFAWIGDNATQPAPPPKPSRVKKLTPMADATGMLQNGYIEAHVNLTTGALQSFRGVNHRQNMFSQQLALRTPGVRAAPGEPWRDPNDTATYSIMAADRVDVVRAGPVLGEIVATGRLVDREGKRLAGYRQTFRLWRARPTLEIDIELTPDQQPRSDGWNSYYCARFAWAEESANVFRDVGLTRQPTELGRFEAPHFIDVDLINGLVSILTLGLPYHRKSGARMLDTLLITRGETSTRFRIALGLNLKQPLAAALDLMTPPAIVSEPTLAPAAGATSWLFHLDAKNIVATHWQPIVENGKPVGFRVRLQETQNRPTKARLSAFRPIQVARECDFSNEPLIDLPTENGAAVVEFAANQWQQIEARW